MTQSTHALVLVGQQLHVPKLQSFRTQLQRMGIALGGERWLSPHHAFEFRMDLGADPKAQAATAARVQAKALAALPLVDLCVSALPTQRKRLLLADMDSTLVQAESIDELAAAAGCGAAVAEMTAAAMGGKVDFVTALQDRVKMIVGLPLAAVETVAATLPITSGAKALAATMSQAGARLVLVSGGFTHLADPLVKTLGFHRGVANRLVAAGGALTGGLGLPLVDARAKADILAEEMTAHGIAASQTLCVGDGANDGDMIQAAGLGVAFYGKPVLRQLADAAINHTDLRTLLYFQGYEDSEIVSP